MEFLKEVLGEGYPAFEAAVRAWNAKPENKERQIEVGNIGTGGYVSKSKYDALEAAKAGVDGQLKTAAESLKKFEGIDADKLNGEIIQLQTELTKQKAAAATVQKEYALKDKLREAGVLDADYIIYKQGGVEKFTFDKDGKPVGVDDALRPFRESSPHLFKAEPGVDYKPACGQTMVKNPWAKENFNLTEQGRIYRENPEQAQTLAAAAGVTINA